jgi:membrane protease YdiL (CAAX protease family)
MTEQPKARAGLSTATLTGLLLSLAGPPAAFIIAAVVYGAEQSPTRTAWGLVIHWINLVALLAVVMRVERQPLSSIGLRPLRWWTIAVGLLAGVMITILAGTVSKLLGLSGDQSYVKILQSLPFMMRLLLALTAGIFEETLFRGYALERLATLLHNKWGAAGVTLAIFTLVHIPAVGLAHLAPVFIAGTFITLLYLWRRDLVVNMVAHATVDGIGLLLIPALAHAGTH